MKRQKSFLWKRSVSMLLAFMMMSSPVSTLYVDAGWANAVYAAESEAASAPSEQPPTEGDAASIPEQSPVSTPEQSPESSSVASPQSTAQESAPEAPPEQSPASPQSTAQEGAPATPPENSPASTAQQGLSANRSQQPSWPIFINGKSTKLPTDGFTSALAVSYNETVSFSLDGYAGTSVLTSDSFYYRPKTENAVSEKWEKWEEKLAPGQYYLGYQFSVDGTTYLETSGKYGIQIVPAALKAPEKLQWKTGSTASWSPVTLDAQGNGLQDTPLTGYEVALYRDGATQAVATQTVAANVTELSFANELLKAAGAYTFTVKALAGDLQAFYKASAQSEHSAATHAVAVTLKGDAGTASVGPASSFILLQGHATKKEQAIQAVQKSGGFTFEKWDGTVAGGITVAAQTASTTLRIADDYKGATAIEITARTTTKVAPVVSSYAAGKAEQYGTLLATVSDAVSGVTEYAFSTAVAVGAIQWTTNTPTVATSINLTHTVEAAGNYFFYAKNAFGNVVKSDKAIQATQVVYKAYGTQSDQTVYLLGDETLTLSTPTRAGFVFGGWFRSAQLTGAAITALKKSDHNSTPIALFAKWSRADISFTTQPQPLDITYDGAQRALSVVVEGAAGQLAYQWYKDNVAITDATQPTYLVKNVADSGKYQVRVSATAENDTITATSSTVTVAIKQAKLTVTAQDKKIPYSTTSLPAYTVGYTGFVGGETEQTSLITQGTITCEYVLGGDAKTYAIVPSGYAAPNYSITHKNGTLTVEPKSVVEANIVATLNQTEWSYTGQPIAPVVTVKEGVVSLDAAHYTVAYQNNTNAGQATAVVTLKGNYSGTISLSFVITKASIAPTVALAGWTYGDTANQPTLSKNTSGGQVTYHYKNGATGPVVTQQPTAAGSYTVYATVAATENYEEATTPEISFVIAKRTITLQASSSSWAYDGNSHSSTSHTQTGSFVGNDGFLSVVVTGAITNVGETPNVITYQLSSSTVADNYNIIVNNGTLTITAQSLSIPVNHTWIGATPGLASWVAVTRSDLTVQYAVSLYRVAEGGTGGTLVSTATATSSEHSFADNIKQDTAANGPAGYYFTVQALPSGGTNKDNYLASDVSVPSKNIYAVKVTVTPSEGIASVTIGGEADAVLLQGESVAIAATAKTGYVLSKSIWSTTNAVVLSFGDAGKQPTTLKVSSALNAPVAAQIEASAENEKPVIEAFTALANTANSEVVFTLQAKDTKGITGWMLGTSTTAPAENDASWTTVNHVASIKVTTTITAADTYYAWVKDDGGNIVRCDAPISVYEILFVAGEGVESGTSLPRMLKVQNTTISLPANTYVKQGFSFKNWSGATGIYANSGSYAANASDTLTAQWSNEQFSYLVNYYFMGTDGSYPATSDTSSGFVTAYGTVISTASPEVQVVRSGMTLDESEGKKNSITVVGANQVLNVYYARNQYTITYSYQNPAKPTPTTTVQTYYYEAPLAPLAKPEIAGYTFVGWLCGEAGQPPATMPNQNITATGSYSPLPASYEVSYYEKNLTGDGYTLNTTLTEKKNALHAQEITFSIADAKQLQGFSVQGVTATVGKAGVSEPKTPPTVTSTKGTVSAVASDTLYVNYYYTRNQYTLTLNVWKGTRDQALARLYQYEATLVYGQAIDASAYEIYDKDNWITPPASIEGYRLATYADWSTGTPPTAMPAGNITVSRDYVSTTTASYQLQIFYEAADGTYEATPAASLTYYGNVGETVTVGEGDKNTIDYSKFGNSLSGFSYYTFAFGHTGNKMSGTIPDIDSEETPEAPPEPLVLKMYLARKTTTSTISYYYNDGTTANSVLIGTLVKSGKWGTEYNHEPLLLFSGSGVPALTESTYTSKNVKIGEAAAESYDFKTNAYVASYSGRSTQNGKDSWPNKRFTTAADLKGTYKSNFGNGTADVISVYYTKADPLKSYAIDVFYNPSNLTMANDTVAKPLTVTHSGTTYRVRIANKTDVFESTPIAAEDSKDYPGVGTITGKYTYTNLKSGFTEVTLTREEKTGTYYTTTVNGENYLYVIDERNQFFAGNRTSYNFLADPLNLALAGYDVVEAYFEDYKNKHSDSADKDTYDDRIAGAHIKNNSFGSLVFDVSKPNTYTFTFNYTQTHRVTYNLGGTTCNDHVFADNATVTPGCTHEILKKQDGHTIVWYEDPSYQNKANNFNIQADITLFGRYEKNELTCHTYAYYQMADALTVGGATISYITAENLAQVQTAEGIKLTSTVATTDTTFVDGAGISQTRSITVTTYAYNGQTVMIDRAYPVLTFTPVSMDLTPPAYEKDGFHYDNTNSGNRLLGHCQTEAVPLAAYFARNEHTLTVVPNDEKVSNSLTTSHRFGQEVSLAAPTKNGYSFDQWTWEKWVGGEATTEIPANWAPWTDAPTLGADKKASFDMPALRLKAEAVWTPADFEQTITHYFQGNTQTYDAELLKTLKGITGIEKTVTFETRTYSATVYQQDGKTLGLSFALTAQYTAWFSGKSIVETGALTIDTADLIAVEETCTLTSEATVNVKAHQVPQTMFDMFSYAFTIYQEGTEVTTLKEGGSFINQHGMQLDYYYTRASNYVIRAVAKAMDGGNSGATLVGSSTHYYGEQVTLTANLSAGYVLKGWYEAQDVLDGYTSEATDLSALPLKSSITEQPVSTDASYTLGVTQALDLVVITQSTEVSVPTVSITGQNSYAYGYAASPSNALMANVTLAGGDQNATYIAGYQWVDKDDNDIEGAISSTYLFPTGQNADTYQYTCKVTVGRNDNGRTVTVTTAPYEVTVTQAQMDLNAPAYSALYDGNPHGAAVNVKTPKTADTYVIYYATSPLTADNYDKDGSTTSPTYIDVAVDASGQPLANTVYYYVHSIDGNYIAATGSTTVTIRPIPLQVKSAKPYSKVFDGKAAIEGAVTQPDTGKYELATGGYYTVEGVLAGEAGDNYRLDFDAAFNDKNKEGANHVTLSKMKVVASTTGKTNNNYTFATNSTLTLSGFIQPFPLDVSWSTGNTFLYDGTPHAPTATLSTQQTPPDSNIALSVGGSQTNTGSYTAYVAVKESNNYAISNYSFSTLASCSFTITKKALTITPNATSVEYNKTAQTIKDFTVVGLVAGQAYSVSTDTSATNAGAYQVKAKDAQITVPSGTAVTDNYDITYAPGTLTITPKAVTMAGITAMDKVYDGTTAATLDLTNATLTGLIAGDELTFDATKISGSFADETAGANKQVTLVPQTGLLTGTSAANYTLATDSQTTASASITQAAITVTAQDVSAVYGENATFTVVYTGLPEGVTLTGTPQYAVRKTGTQDAFEPYDTAKHGAGTYDIQLTTSGLSATNHSFVPAAGFATLTVTARPIAVQAKKGEELSKVYDATAAATIDAKHYEFVPIADNAASGVVNSDALVLSPGVAAAYSNKKVSAPNPVTVRGCALANPNYTLQNTSFEIAGTITQKPLTVTANDATITYGASAPTYTVAYKGFATGESAADLTDSLSIVCRYDVDNADDRKAATYSITASGYAVDGNYSFTYTDGTLTVDKAEILVTANSETFTYRGNESLPVYTGTLTGFQYTDAQAVVANVGYITYKCAATLASVAGKYPITPVLPTGDKALAADNYTFRAVDGQLTVDRNVIKIGGIVVADKQYDGTTAVASGAIDTINVTYEGIKIEDDTSTNKGITVTGTYTDAAVGANKEVTLTVALNAYLSQRYGLDTGSQTTATAAITQQALTVKAKDITIAYGAAPPAYTVECTGLVNGETQDVLTGSLTFAASYQANDDAGTYPITPAGYTSSNYNITHTQGTLTVNAAKLKKPSPKWSTTAAGTVEWAAVSPIGNVPVAGYKLTLYKNGGAIEGGAVELAATATSYDLKETIRASGAGAYTVKVAAIASTETTVNKDYKNVTSSDEGVTAAPIYATKVSVIFAADAITKAGGVSLPTINGVASYIVVAGESGLPIEATIVNATGYTVDKCASANGTITVSDGTLVDKTYTAKAAVGSKLGISGDLSIVITLAATPATATATVTTVKASAKYGYNEANAPKLTVQAEAVTGDNITTSGYTYSYQWMLKLGIAPEEKVGEDKNTLTFPSGRPTGEYKVYCNVTATRSDNSQSKTVKSTDASITIEKAEFVSTVALTGWTYGEMRNTPSVSHNPGNGAVTYEYSANGTSWSTTMPTDVGKHKIRATIAQSLNYETYTTADVDFTIAQAKLAAPSGLVMQPSATAPYGKATWSAVEGIATSAQNGLTTPVTVSYEVKLYHKEENETSKLVTNATTSDCEYDLTEHIGSTGIYTFTVTAISSAPSNCANSAESAASDELNVSGSITADGNKFEKPYDGTGIQLKAESGYAVAGSVVAYQWYRNEVAIADATTETLAVTYVEESGVYSCNITVDNVTHSSTRQQVTITPRAITIVSPSSSKAYDGTPLSDASWSVDAATSAVDGEKITCTLTASITEVGSVLNTISAVSITTPSGKLVYKDGENNNNYTVTRTEGTLSVTQKGIDTGKIDVSTPQDAVYDATQQSPSITVTDSQVAAAGKALVLNTDYTLIYSNNVNAGTASVVVTGKGSYTGTVARTFTIAQRPLTVRSEDITKPYDGSPLTSTGGIIALQLPNSAQTLATGDKLSTVTFTGTLTQVGKTDNLYEALVIKNASNVEVTDNYTLTCEYGTITIAPIRDTITINGDPGKPYDAIAVSNPEFTQQGTGAVTFQYYTKNSGEADYTLLAAPPKDAGDYFVKAVVAASDNYSASESAYKPFKVTKRILTITVHDKKSIYGQPLVPLTHTVNEASIPADDALDIALTTTATAGSDVGDYPITVGTNANASSNYTINITSGTYGVEPATMQVTASGYTGVYDKAAHGIGVSVSAPAGTAAQIYYGSVPIDENNYTNSTIAQTTNPTYTDVGSYPVHYFIRAKNYTDASGSQTVSITRAEQILTAKNVAATYDGAPHGVTATSSGDGTISYQNNSNVEAGSYTVNIAASATKNYNAASGTATVAIAQRPITIQATDGTKTYDQQPLAVNAYTIAAGSLANGDVLASVTINGSQTDAGTSSNTPSAASITTSGTTPADRTQSYAVAYADGKLVVAPATQAPPTGLTSQNESIETKGDGSIGSIGQGMEYRKVGEAAYTVVTLQMVQSNQIPNLTSGTYEVRYAAKKNYTASDPAQVVIGFDTAAVYALSLITPAFAEVTEGYAQPLAGTLVIASKGNVGATITAVASSNTAAFVVTGSGSAVAEGGTLTSYGIRPVMGLAAGTYESEITVTYGKNATLTGKVSLQVNPKPEQKPLPPAVGDAGGTTVPQPPNKEETVASKPQTEPDAPEKTPDVADAEKLPEPEEHPKDNTQGALLEDKRVVQEENLAYGSGNIKVIVHCAWQDQRRIDAAIISTQQVVAACLSEQEQLAVAGGDSIEIRLTVTLHQNDVPQADAELIMQEVEQMRSEFSGLSLGEYLDITLEKRLNAGEWEGISQAKEDIAIEIMIPEWLEFPNTEYFIIRAHNNEVKLLEDMDEEPSTITVPSRYFSTYAILYTTSAAPACIWHIVMLLVLAGYLLMVFIGKRKRRKKYALLLAAAIAIFVVAAILGGCALDWPVALVSTAACAAAMPVRKLLISRQNNRKQEGAS